MPACVAAAVACGAGAAEFIWRGQLADGGHPAEGSYDLSVTVYAGEAGDEPLAETIEFGAVTVTDGEFALPLALDHATGLNQVWLEIGVRDAGDPAGFETLAQRERVVLQPSAVCPAAWETRGNAGLGATNFLGTTDETAVRIRAGNRNALRILPRNDPSSYGDAPNLILGSRANAVVGAGIRGATIAGGGSSLNGGGNPCPSSCGNLVGGDYASVGGGDANRANGSRSRVGGGGGNQADGADSTIGGGFANKTTGTLGTVGGGSGNIASGPSSTVPGGAGNYAGGQYSFAAGRGARVRDASETGDFDGDEGSFVWSDATTAFPATFSSSGPNQFLVNANGGFALNATPVNADVEMTISASSMSNYANLFLLQRGTNAGVLWSVGDVTGGLNNDAALYIDQYNSFFQRRRLTLAGNGDLTVTAGAFKPGGGSWASSSDGRLKKDLAPVEHALDRLLALEGVSFEYADPDPAARPAGRRIGFVAQQVAPLFPHWVGRDGEGFLTVGPQGFEALAVEAVRELRAEKDREIAELRAQIETLREQQERLLASLGAKAGDGTAGPRPAPTAGAE